VGKGEQLEREFVRLVVDIEKTDYLPDAVFPTGSRGEPQTMNEFVGLFVGCRRAIPPEAREALANSYRNRLGVALRAQHLDTYARAARRVRELRRGESTLRHAKRTRTVSGGGEQ
jgi:hypothetical protein